MADITMCDGENCPIHLKESCYRHTAEVDGYQSWFMKSPIIDGNEECDQYWEVK